MSIAKRKLTLLLGFRDCNEGCLGALTVILQNIAKFNIVG